MAAEWQQKKARMLLDLDNDVADLRRFFDSLDNNEKSQFITFVQQVRALEQQSTLGVDLPISIPCKNFPPEGRIIWAGPIHFPAWIVIEALEAWTAGEEYAPANPIDR